MLARKSVGALLDEKRKQLEKTQQSIESSRQVLAGSEGERDAIVAREAAGELTADAATDLFVEVSDREGRHRAELDRLARVEQLVAGEIAELERQAQLEAYAAATAAFVDAREAAVATSMQVARTLGQLVDRLAALEKLRSRADELAAAARELQPADAPSLPTLDEPSWLEPKVLRVLVADLKDGPRRPAEALAAATAATDHAREAEIKWAVSRAEEMPLASVLPQVPEALRPEVERRVAAMRKQQQADRERDREAAFEQRRTGQL